MRYNDARFETDQSKGMGLRRIAENAPVYYQFDQWSQDADAPVHGVFTRLGGVSQKPWASLNVGSTVGDDPEAVAENRRRLLAALDLQAHQECTVWQVHSADTIIVNGLGDNGPVLARADGMVTQQPDVVLTMRFADCVPVLFYDPVKLVVGIAHAGWRGTVAGAGPSVVQAMIDEFGCQVEDIQAGVGPSIGPAHYQVGEEVVDAVQHAFSDPTALVRRASDGSAYLDLWAANRNALAALGVTQIEVANICTASHTDEFYSHRAEHGQTGRFGAAIALPSGR